MKFFEARKDYCLYIFFQAYLYSYTRFHLHLSSLCWVILWEQFSQIWLRKFFFCFWNFVIAKTRLSIPVSLLCPNSSGKHTLIYHTLSSILFFSRLLFCGNIYWFSKQVDFIWFAAPFEFILAENMSYVKWNFVGAAFLSNPRNVVISALSEDLPQVLICALCTRAF